MTENTGRPRGASYADAGVDIEAGERAVELFAPHARRATRPEVLGGLGGFAGLFAMKNSYRQPLLASSTDGVGTKIAVAQAMDVHDTVGIDLVAMVVDDLVVCGAEPLFLQNYIAIGSVVPEHVAQIVSGIAEGCVRAGCALLGGETAEHPGLMAPGEYDVSATGVGIVEADEVLGADNVRPGDVVVGMASSGLHSNGYSLVRHIITRAGISYGDNAADFGSTWGEALLEPTRLYTLPLLRLIEASGGVHALSHVTGGGIAANLARVLPQGSWVEVDRSTWSPSPVFRVLSDIAGSTLESAEGTWNLGIGFLAVVAADRTDAAIAALNAEGMPSWQVGTVGFGPRPAGEFEQGAKGVDGGAVRLVGAYADGAK